MGEFRYIHEPWHYRDTLPGELPSPRLSEAELLDVLKAARGWVVGAAAQHNGALEALEKIDAVISKVECRS